MAERIYSIFLFAITFWLGLIITVQGLSGHLDSVQCFQEEGTLAGDCDYRERFRRVNGQCNNLDNPLWGSSSDVLYRIVPSAYQDGESSPRVMGSDGQPLPSARTVSVNCHPRRNVTSDVTMLIIHWGQFLDHDITLTSKDKDNCTCNSTSSECFPIALDNDEFFTDRDCLEFMRSNSILATDSQHTMPVRQQFNELTSYIDASNVYGSTDELHEALRQPDSFELKVSRPDDSGKDFLPENPDPEACSPVEDGLFCFLAGDERNNDQPGLNAMHTLFLREHNRIANELHRLTQWGNERIFQETRKILGALVQRITFNEWLPIVIGPDHIVEYELSLSDYYYNSSLRANIINGFATAAFRFAHSLLPESIDLSFNNSFALKDVFQNPHLVVSSFDEVFSGGATQNTSKNDRFFSHSVTRHLLETERGNGFDLISLNIQRSRDHGLPPYYMYREWCGLPAIASLNDMFPGDPDAASTYRSVEDVDLFTGGISETPVDGGLVGPTFACIIGTQFHRLKHADRFFYLNTDGAFRFTSSQRSQINKMTLSKIICEHTELESIQENIFLPEDPTTNPPVLCSDLPSLNLTPWVPSLRFLYVQS